MKKRLGIYLLGLALCAGCASSVKETVIWSSEADRPQWTIVEPELGDGGMMFVGVAENLATETEARDEAMKNVTTQVIRYMGTLAKDKYEKVSTSYGLSSGVIDPTASARNYEKQLAANVAKQIKARKWYFEKWQKPVGVSWKAFVMASVPMTTVNDSFKNSAKDNLQAAQRQAQEATTDTAKKQAESAAKFWEDMTKQGVME